MGGNRDYGTGGTNIAYNASGSIMDWYTINKKNYTYEIVNTVNTVNTASLWSDSGGTLWSDSGGTSTATVSDANWIIPKYYDNNIWSTSDEYLWKAPVVLPGERIRQMIQARMAPAFHRRRTHLSIAADVREARARQTLRRIIGDQAYRKFIRNGFITVVPKSGLTYRIFTGHGITEVFDRGIMVDRLCVVLQGDFPPTDSLLMRYLLILNDEGEFSEYAIKHHVSQNRTKLVFPAQAKVESLTKVWSELQVA